MSDAVTWIPDAIPTSPKGFSCRMEMHINFGEDGGGASFSLYDPEGRHMPFGYQYDTRKGGLTGYVVKGREGVMTWAELVEYWPKRNLKAKKAKS